MQKFLTHEGIVAPLDRVNVDTDAIIPKQFLKSIKRTGFGPFLFDEWRYRDLGEPGMEVKDRPLQRDFVLNQPRYKGASILLARANFGCGSSREHACWALQDYGFRVIIAESFADIFANNAVKNGLLTVALRKLEIDKLFSSCQSKYGFKLKIDLKQQQIQRGDGVVIYFDIDPFTKYCLLNGLDEIGLTLQSKDKIKQYEEKRRQLQPWLFGV